MQLVEQHAIDRKDPRYKLIDDVAFKSKNLYNAILYEVRQSFIHQGIYLNYNEMDKRMKQHEAYKALPAKVAQKVVEQVHETWVSFFEARKAYKEDPSKFTGCPRLPKYKHKTAGRNILTYNMQAVSRGKKTLQRGIIKPSQLAISVKTKQDPITIKQVRIVPKNGFYVGIDLGVTNLAAIASNRKGWVPRLVNGRPLKARNQWYNKRIKELKNLLPKDERDRVTKQMERITNKRNRQVDHYLHTASKHIIDFLAKEGVGTIIVGKNPLWKQEVNGGRHNNQNFVCIPHARFIDMLTYKDELVGIKVIVTEESYTSKASFLDLDDIPVYKPDDEEEHVFSGKRVYRGLYRAKDGTAINADVQGAYNMIRKRRPKAFSKAKGVAGYGVHPVRLAV
jgi:putative transposase